MMANSWLSTRLIAQALLVALLAFSLFDSALAVELVGKPVPMISSSSEAAQLAVVVEPQPLAQTSTAAKLPDQASALDKHFEPGMDTTAITLMVIFCVAGPVILIIVLAAMHYRAKERHAKNINANIERLLAAGRDIPIELLRGDDAVTGADIEQQRRDVGLHKGIKNLCIGTGIFICLTIIFSIEFGAVGFILMSIGVSQLWIWKLSNPKTLNTKDHVQTLG